MSVRTCPTLFWPTGGALGRRTLDVASDLETLRRRLGAEQVWPIEVEAPKARALFDRLQTEFELEIDTLHHQPRYGLDFVRSPKTFHAFHNCNHETRSWLRELGCEVRCESFVADFVVEDAAGAASP